MFRRALVCGLVAAVVVGPTAAESQVLTVRSERDEPAAWRRWAGAVAGALIVGVPAAYAQGTTSGGCGSSCTAALSAAVGGWIGHNIGMELDKEALEAWRSGTTLAHGREHRRLGFTALRLSGGEGALAVVGRTGVAALRPDLSVLRRGGELRGILAATVLPGEGGLLAGTAAGLLAYPLASGPGALGERVLPLQVSALAAAPGGGVVIGTSREVQRLRRDGRTGQWTVVARGPDPTSGAVADVAFGRDGIAWVLEGDVVRARDADELLALGGIRLPAAGRFLDTGADLGAVTGTDGRVYLLDLSDAMTPRFLGELDVPGLHFVHAAAVQDDRLYLAGGDDGLVVLDVAEPTRPSRIGVVRDVGDVTDVIATETGIYVLARESADVRRLWLRAAGPMVARRDR